MKIEANDKEVQDIFTSGYFKIPRFQRPYSWEKEEIENFWNDIVEDKSNNYFIGSMVVYQTKKPYFGIVDGQQRLTTITIILSVIRDALITLDEINLARGIHKFIEAPNNDFINEFTLNPETSFPYLQNQIQSFKEKDSSIKFNCDIGAEEKNLKIAYETLSNKLQEYIPIEPLSNIQHEMFRKDEIINKIKELRDKFLSLKLVFIQLDNEDDAYLIFETLNARGRDLRTSDLVKNLILKTVKSNNFNLDSPKEAWNNIIEKFDDIAEANVLDSFLLHYWISKYEYTTDKKLFTQIKKYISSNNGNAKLLLEDLGSYAIQYCKMINPSNSISIKEQKKLKTSLESLNNFKVKQQSSFVLSLLVAYENRKITIKQITTAIEKIEHFHFIFNVITQQRSSGSIATMYSQHAIDLSKSKNNDETQKIFASLNKKISEKIPSYEEFEVKFIELEYLSNKTRSKATIKYALSKILGDQHNGLDINHTALTIEHLIPESFIKNGTNPDLIANIGNLILLDNNTNSHKLKDKSPSDKIKILKDESYPLGLNFINGDNWEECNIKERAKLIAKFIYTRVQLI